jgi:hypothetical protein
MKKYIKFRFNKDNYFAELKDLELMNDRFVRLQEIDQYAGKYYSHMWVRKNVLKQTDEEIEENDEQIAQEIESVQYNPEILQQELMQQQAQPETKDVKNK